MQIPQVLDAIQLSHATFNKIRQNLWWAFGYNLVGIPLAAGALLPSMGIALTPSISGPAFAPPPPPPPPGGTCLQCLHSTDSKHLQCSILVES